MTVPAGHGARQEGASAAGLGTGSQEDGGQWCAGSSARLCSSLLCGSLLPYCFYFTRRGILPGLLHSSKGHAL